MRQTTGQATSDSVIATTTFEALGTTASLCTTRPDAINRAQSILRSELAAVDLACSRFRADSELSSVHRANGRAVVVSPLLAELIAVGLDAADRTAGAVDPTVGASLVDFGYACDFDEVTSRVQVASSIAHPAPGWQCIELDRTNRQLRVPPGVIVDLGATAKAFVADRACARIAAATDSAVLVNLGGDIAVSGSPEGGWVVGLALDCRTAPTDTTVAVSVGQGGLASSGTAVRAWRSGDRTVHHIINPTTGDSANTCWKLVTVAAANCLEANVASTRRDRVGKDSCRTPEENGCPKPTSP